MKISGFSYIRNGFKYEYPFLQSISSILPICDELIIAVGDSSDGTKEAILNIGCSKIRIIDTIWDEQLRTNGKIFAQQANIALREVRGDWVFHIQADEVIHESDIEKIFEQIKNVNNNPAIEGLLFDFLNFYGNFNFLNNTRYQHKKEIRVFRNNLEIYSYGDSQGFRKYPSYSDYLNDHNGYRIKVQHTKIPVYHYSYVRNPEQMNIKSKIFESFWHDDQYISEKYGSMREFDYYNMERVKPFTGKHPSVMKNFIADKNWDFNPGKLRKRLSLKDRIIYGIEDMINFRIGEYKNYILVN